MKRRLAKEWKKVNGPVRIDGFNLMITLEVALSGSLLLEGDDGTIRDLAGLRGTYQIVDKTERAAELIFSFLADLGVQDAIFYLDQPVSNSGRLKTLLLEKAQGFPVHVTAEVVPNPDRILWGKEGVITSDAIILNECVTWYNLARRIIESAIPQAWIFHLPPETKPQRQFAAEENRNPSAADLEASGLV